MQKPYKKYQTYKIQLAKKFLKTIFVYHQVLFLKSKDIKYVTDNLK